MEFVIGLESRIKRFYNYRGCGAILWAGNTDLGGAQ